MAKSDYAPVIDNVFVTLPFGGGNSLLSNV
jgi:hypothetical protein